MFVANALHLFWIHFRPGLQSPAKKTQSVSEETQAAYVQHAWFLQHITQWDRKLVLYLGSKHVTAAKQQQVSPENFVTPAGYVTMVLLATC